MRNKSLRKRRVVMLLLIIAMSHLLIGHEYEVQGTMEKIVFRPDGEEQAKNTIDYQIVSRGPQWLISFKRHKFAEHDRTEVACDGSNCYYLVDMRTARQRKGSVGKLVGFNDGHAEIIPGIVPKFEPDGVILSIWFTYLSHNYLDRYPNAKLPPPEVVYVNGYHTKNAPLQDCQLMRFSLPPRLPQRAVFWEDGLFRGTPLEAAGQSLLKPTPWPMPYDRGFTNVIYIANKVTNLGSLLLPLESIMYCFIPNVFNEKSPPMNRDDLRINKIVYLRTVSAQPYSARRGLLPELPGLTTVRDQRLSNAVHGAVDYVISNQWLTIDEILSRPEYRNAAIASQVTSSDATTFSKVFFVILLLFFLSFPLLVKLYQRWLNLRAPKTNQSNL